MLTVAQQQHAVQPAIADQQATVVAIDGVPTAVDLVLLAGPLFAGAKKLDTGDLQPGAAVLPAEFFAGSPAQAFN